jgi:GNAT superfamily N-acetyltransferase
MGLVSTELIELVAQAEQVLPPTGDGVEAERVAGIPCVRYDIDQPWAAQAKLMYPPDPDAFDAAIDWLRRRTPRWRVTTRGAYAADPVFAERDLTPTLELSCLALAEPDELSAWSAASPAASPAPPVPGLEIGPARDRDEFLVVFGTDLAALVTPRVFAHPSALHLVGRLDGRPVACARVHFAAGTAYVSGIGVASAYRGNGIGSAISAAAARHGLARNARLVWLTAAEDVRPLYTRLGFRPFDVHVQLG